VRTASLALGGRRPVHGTRLKSLGAQRRDLRVQHEIIIVAIAVSAAFNSSRYAPVGADNPCHQAIFMDHASGAVAPPDTEVVQVGDTILQRAKRRGLVQGTVRPMSVIEVLVLAQDGHQVACPGDAPVSPDVWP
jgi:hypothetical protein